MGSLASQTSLGELARLAAGSISVTEPHPRAPRSVRRSWVCLQSCNTRVTLAWAALPQCRHHCAEFLSTAARWLDNLVPRLSVKTAFVDS